MKKDKKDILVETLQYLDMPGMAQYKSDALPHEIVCRIQNLLPDTCNLCSQSYCVKLGEKPIISCARCGQGCHNSCVLQIMGKTENDLDESNNFGATFANPFSTLGLFYLCAYCQGETIPNKNSLKIRSGQGNNQDAAANLPQSSTVNQVADTAATGTTIQNSTSAPVDSANSTAGETSQMNVLEGTSPNTTTTALTSTNNSVPPTHKPPVCRDFRTGRCKHGVSGKKDGTCPYSHPRACTRFLNNGNRSRGGCKKGNNCRLFHPNMCYSSLRERKCSRDNCKFMHIKGTARTEAVPTQNQRQSRPSASVPTQNQRQSRRSATQATEPESRQVPTNINRTTILNGDSFLEVIKAMQDQFSQVTCRLQQLDDNYQRLCYQLPGFPVQQKYPAMQPHFPARPVTLQPTMGQPLPYYTGPVGSSLGLPVSN